MINPDCLRGLVAEIEQCKIKISAERDRVRKLTDGLCQIADGCDEAEELRERATNVLSRNAVRD